MVDYDINKAFRREPFSIAKEICVNLCLCGLIFELCICKFGVVCSPIS